LAEHCVLKLGKGIRVLIAEGDTFVTREKLQGSSARGIFCGYYHLTSQFSELMHQSCESFRECLALSIEVERSKWKDQVVNIDFETSKK